MQVIRRAQAKFLLRAGIYVGLSIFFIYLIYSYLYKNIYGTNLSANYENTGNPIYVITPTYRRAEQIPELTRTAQTMLHVKNLFWIVVDDTVVENDDVKEYLSESGTRYVYLIARMPEEFHTDKNPPRGVANRNKGLEWVRSNAKHGVVYFGDDDNTYDVRIFEEMRSTKVVSMFPVGLVTRTGLSTPIVKDGVVVDFYDGWLANRKFPVDMAGFAISVETFLKYPNATMPHIAGYEEVGILNAVHLEKKDVEPKAQNCTKIWVWHTQTIENEPVSENKTMDLIKIWGQDSNLKELRKLVWRGK